MKRIYLAGAIDRIDRNVAEAWREEARRIMGDFDLRAVDPLADEWMFCLSDAEIVNRDKFLLHQSDAVLLDARTPGFGSGMETQTAYDWGLPIVAWGVGGEEAGVWLRHHCVYIAPRVSEAVEYIVGMFL